MRGLPDLVPAHLRHFEAAAVGLALAGQIKAAHLAGDQPQRGGVALFAVLQQHLHAYAHAKQRFAGRGLAHGLFQAAVAQGGHAVAHGPLAGQHHAAGRMHHGRVVRDLYLHAAVGCGRLHGLPDGAQIAHAVIDNGDGVFHGLHSWLRL